MMDVLNHPIFQEFRKEFPEVSPDTVEAVLQFQQVASRLNLGKEALFGRYGITTGRFDLLMLLRHEEKRALSPSELARRTNVSRATMTQFVDALERDGFVKRVSDEHDRRSMSVQLTPKGDALLKRILPEFFEGIALFTRLLSRSERKQLLHLLEKIAEGTAEPEV